jgi:4-hydroxybenzoate polyprenyltransferase
MSSGSRKKRKRKRRGQGAARAKRPSGPEAMERGYARARAKNDEARARLKPLPKGERPGAVTVGAIVALLLALANVVALIVRYDPDEPRKTLATALGAVILLVVSAGMWRARYWAVLGMQTLLALAIIGSAIAVTGAGNAAAVLLVIAILLSAGTLFWFLIKAMARIQMPERPGAKR